VVKDGFFKEERKDWLAYDETFTNPLGDEFEDREINSFKELETDDTPYNGWGCHGSHVLVGNGKVTNPTKCGSFFGLYGCLNVELHDLITLEGHNHKGKVFIRKRFHSCDKPTCPVCFMSGWAVREARNIEDRISKASSKFGLAEHMVASVPQTDYSLPFEKLKRKILKVLKSRYVLGGVHIFHAFRYANPEEARKKHVPVGWYWSPHFHILGFVDGGYSKCRKCENMMVNGQVKYPLKCLGCKGFEGQTRRMWNKEGGKNKGYIVLVMGKRKSVFGTAWYQLNHASIVSHNERAHVATWFGTCSKRKLKLAKGDRLERATCPICNYPLERVNYAGDDYAGLMGEWWSMEFEDDFLDENATVKWVRASSSRYEYF
jgi:hypothetical protein